MGDEWEKESQPETESEPGAQPQPQPETGYHGNTAPLAQDELEKRLEDIKRTVVQGASEVQQRIKRVVGKAGEYWQQQSQPTMTPQEATTEEEQRIRQLANLWSTENWRVARELGTYMEIVSWSIDEVWEVTLQTRWETRTMEMLTEPYAGRPVGRPQPLLPVWDYDLPAVVGLKSPPSRTRLPGMDEIISCTECNGTGRALCTACTGRGWSVCPDCRGRTKKRCATCRGRGYVADWVETKKKPFLKKQADNLTNSVTGKVSDVFDGIRQQGVPIPNPMDTDPANKGKTVPCPDCVNGEVDCSCGNGKRVCEVCEGGKTVLCARCTGTGKVVRHREIARRFDLHTQTKIVGNSPIPERRLAAAGGELVYNAELTEALQPDAAPDNVPLDVWRHTVELAQAESNSVATTSARSESSQSGSRASLQVLELVRIPYTKVDYRYSNQDFSFYIYDSSGHEKFHADRYPPRWDRIERLVRAITTDLMTPAQQDTPTISNPNGGGYRVPIEFPPYSITEDDEKP